MSLNGPRCDALEPDQLEPIAIIGFSLKFPQDAVSPATFWAMMEEKRCAMTEWPKDRISLDAFYHPDTDRRSTISVRGAHLLQEDLAVFDASFFSISATEAVAMDPQQRILLETTYRALENAGIPMERVVGSKTGVYTGSMADDYKVLITKDLEDMPKYAATGLSMNLLANRLSWFFNLTGPSVNLDSACSSSLMSLDFACQGLRNGDSSMALVAGANVVLAVESVVSLTNMSFLSPDSRCYSFDDRANGYARGEGFGVVVIKRISDAIRDGDTIRAIIRSTGSNQDGHTPGITQPSKEAQVTLIRETYLKAGLDFATTRFFEAHGTGTALGDPIEADAIGSVFRSYRSPKDPLFIGAVKSNVGHLEAASGIAGLIKTIMVLEKGIIPPNTNFEHLNSKIDADLLNIKIPVDSTPWPNQGLRRASVNSFGFGGSNSHAVLEDALSFLRLRGLTANHCTREALPVSEAPANIKSPNITVPTNSALHIAKDEQQATQMWDHRADGIRKQRLSLESETRFPPTREMTSGCPTMENEQPDEDTNSSRSRLLIWTAADEGATIRLTDAYHNHFSEKLPDGFNSVSYLEDLSYTLAFRRSSLPWKSFAVVDSVAALANLKALLLPPVRSSEKLGIGFVFTGQGAQYKEMGMGLLIYPVFANALRAFDVSLREFGCEWSVFDELLGKDDASKIHLPQYSQPLCTALQIALVDLLRSFNIMPSAVVGHSSGEIAAAYAVGGLSLQSACTVSYYRGKLAGDLTRSSRSSGAMMSVNLPETEIRSYIRKITSQDVNGVIAVACVNSPRNVTVSGDEALIDLLKSHLDSDHILARKLKTGVAYHSPRMQEIASEYFRSIQGLERAKEIARRLVMISSVTSEQISTIDVLSTAEYWVRNMIEPVKFSQALARMVSQSKAPLKKKLGVVDQGVIYDLVEIGPHSTLQNPIKETLEAAAGKRDVRYHSCLSRYDASVAVTLKTVGRLYSLGYPAKLGEINQIQASGALPRNKILADLPEYQFNHSLKYWHESRLSKNSRLRADPHLDLLGTTMPDWNPLEGVWRKFLDVSETPWVEDHKVSGTTIYPAAGMIVMALEGARQIAQKDRHITGYQLKDTTFSNPIPVPSNGQRTETQLYIRPTRNTYEKEISSLEFRICVLEDNQWNEACRGTVQTNYKTDKTEVDGGREAEEISQHFKQLYDHAVSACDRKVETKRMYRHFQNIGLTYGPAFQALDNLAWNGDGEVIGEIKTFDWAAQDTHHDVQPHLIHPVTLDAAAQLMWVALTKGATNLIATGIPTKIKNAWIASAGLGYPEPIVLRAYSTSTFRGLRGTDSSMFALDQMGNLKMSVSHMETTNVSSSGTLLPNSSNRRQLCYSMDWKPDIDFLTPEQTMTYCGAKQFDLAEPTGFYQDLGLVLLSFISRNLEEVIEMDSQDFKPHIKKYVEWMKMQVAKFRAGDLPDIQADWASRLEDTRYMESLTNHIEGFNAQGKLFVTFGRHLLSLIHGKIDPLELLFHDNLAEMYYTEVFDSVSCCKKLWNYLDALAHKNPALKILEVGAGTGSMTGHILSPIILHGEMESGTPRFSQYDYTDISEGYFEKARERFPSESQRMSFKVLNIEEDPTYQGFVPGSYDLVVASSVLHITRDLNVTIQNVRKLLKPGGKLILFEVTKPEKLRTGFVFGTLTGWWLSTEEYRKWSPCISEKQWDRVLSQNGFSGVNLVFRDYQTQSCHEMSIIMSTATEKAKDTKESLPDSRTVILITQESQVQGTIADQIRAELESLGKSECDVLPFEEVSMIKDTSKISFIFLQELEKPFLYDLNESTYNLLQTTLSTAQHILWVTHAKKGSPSSPKFGMISGLARVLCSENTSRRFVTLAFEDRHIDGVACASTIFKVLEATHLSSTSNGETEYIQREGMLMVNRIVEANYLNHSVHTKIAPQFKIQEFQQGPPLTLTVATPGLLDSLQWTEDSNFAMEFGPNAIEIEVKSVGVNFRDLLVVLGRQDEDTLGCECAGIVTRVGAECNSFQAGDRVCAAIIGCLNTYARCDAQLAVKIPDSLSFIEAAALPVTGVTAYFSLVETAHLQRGETILIHAGSGGTGQMAIQVGQSIGAEIFVTVGFEAKKQLLMDLYGIPEDHIFYSRNTTFAQGIMRMTKNRGVDVVLNSLSGDSLIASWESIAPFGRFIEIGKSDIKSNIKLPMSCFAKNVSFCAVAVDYMCNHRPALFRKSLLAVMDMVTDKSMRVAHPLHVYPISDTEEAFRSLQSGKNTGKTVLSVNPTDLVPTIVYSRPQYDFDPNATYLIAGGLGGLGRSAARWMASRGARNLLLLSRSGPGSEAASRLLRELETLGVHVEAPQCDVSSAESLSNALTQCSAMPPIKGCIQGTMVLRDSVFENMTFSDWTTTIRSKVHSSCNLHVLLPRNLDFFVMLSSLAGVAGSPGQANYAAGNTYQAALAHHRVLAGEKATAIDLGWMGSVGVIAENEKYRRGKEDAADMAQIEEAEFHALLDHYCDPNLELTSPPKTQPMVGLVTPAQFRTIGLEAPYWMQRPVFAPLAQMGLVGLTSSDPDVRTSEAVDYMAEILGAQSLTEAGAVVVSGLVRKLCKVLSAASAEEIDVGKPLHSYGVDSLLAVELRNWFAKEFKADVAIFDIMGAENIAKVGDLVAERSLWRKWER